MPKQTVVILISFISLIIIISFGVLAINRARVRLLGNLIDQYYEQEEILAAETATLLKTEIISLQDKLQAISHLNAVRFPTSTETCIQAFEDVSENMLVKTNNLGRVDINGNFVCSLNKALIGVKASTFGSYIDDIFTDHKPVMSRAVKVPTVDGFVFSLHIPVYDENQNFNGTLGGAIYFNYLEETYIKDIVLPNQGYIAIYDDNADLLFHPKRDLIGKSLFSDEIQGLFKGNQEVNTKFREAINEGIVGRIRYTVEGTERISVFYPIEIFPGRRWVVTIITPTQEIENSLINAGVTSDFIRLAVLLTILLIITPLIILHYLNKSVFKPLSVVTQSIDKVSEGDFNQKVEYISLSTKDEINRLVMAFNKMAKQLKSFHMNKVPTIPDTDNQKVQSTIEPPSQ